MAKRHISLQPTEQTLVTAAATIYAAYITAGHVVEGQESVYLEKAIKAAIRIAKITDDSVQADKEFD